MVGMLRSGTTLTEQILASPPNVFGAGELSFWSSRLAGRVTSAAAEGASAMEFGDTALADLGNEYLELLRHLSRDALRVTNLDGIGRAMAPLRKIHWAFDALARIRAALKARRLVFEKGDARGQQRVIEGQDGGAHRGGIVGRDGPCNQCDGGQLRREISDALIE